MDLHIVGIAAVFVILCTWAYALYRLDHPKAEPIMPKTNLNDLAKQITEAEGGKVNLSIAQVKEVLRITLRLLADMPLSAVAALLERVKK